MVSTSGRSSVWGGLVRGSGRRILASLLLLPVCLQTGVAQTTKSQPTSSPVFPDRPPGFLLGIDDILEVSVWKEPDLSLIVLVRPDGRITVPLAGEVVAAGKTPVEVQEEVARNLSRYVRNASVTVMVKQVKSSKIYVLGNVKKPDMYVLLAPTTVLQAIALAGGIRPGAYARRVVVLRRTTPVPQRFELDLKRLLKDHDSGEISVRPADIVFVR